MHALNSQNWHKKYIGMSLNVHPNEHDEFHEFVGHCIGIRNGHLQVVDQDEDTWDVDESQVTFADPDDV